MKKLLSMLLALAMVLSMFSTVSFAEGEIVDGDDVIVGEEVLPEESSEEASEVVPEETPEEDSEEISEEETLPEAPVSDNLIYGLLPTNASDLPTDFSWMAQKNAVVLTDGVINSDEDTYTMNYSFNLADGQFKSFAYEKEGMSIKEVNVAEHQPTDLAVKGIGTLKVEFLIDGTWCAAGMVEGMPGDKAGSILAFTSEEAIVADGVRVSVMKASGKGYNTVAISEIQVFSEIKTEDAIGTLEVNLAKMETPEVSLNAEALTVKAGAATTIIGDASVTDGGTLSYRWLKDDEVIVGETAPLLTLSDITADTAGVYTFEATNKGANNPAVNTASVVVEVEGERTNLALNKAYTWTSSYLSNYPDTDTKEMTDGNIPSAVNYGNAGYVGAGNNAGLSFTIDLGEVCTVDGAAAVLMNTATAGLTMPGKVTFYYSTNNAIFEELGTWTYADKNKVGVMVAEVEAAEPVFARYITVEVDGVSNVGLHFISEGMVYGVTGAEGYDPTAPKEGNLMEGARWTTNIADVQFIYSNGPSTLPAMYKWLTDGDYAIDKAYSTTAGIVGFNDTGYLEFDLGENTTFKQLVIHTAMKQSFAADYADYKDVVIEAYKDGVWYKLNAPTSLPYESQKTYYFSSEEDIVASKIRFNVVGRKGLNVMAFTEFEMFYDAYAGETEEDVADVALVMPTSTVAVPSIEITNDDVVTVAAGDYVSLETATTIEGTMAEGEKTTYQWYKGSSTLSNTSQIYTVAGVAEAADAVYKVYVENKSADGMAYSYASDEVTVKVEGEVYNYAAGMPYEYNNYEANVVYTNSNYQDTDMKELTDGNVPTAVSYGNAGYVGFGSWKTAQITFDFGEYGVKFDEVKAIVMSTNNSGILLPGKFSVSYRNSTEEEWTKMGEWNNTDTNRAGIQVASVKAEEPVRARYVTVSSYNGSMMFMSEVLVLGDAPAAEAPVFTTDLNPNETVTMGDSLVLSVEASVVDGGTLSYQWFKDGEAIEGETEYYYGIYDATEEAAGVYYVEVTNTLTEELVTMVPSTACVVAVEEAVIPAETPVISTDLEGTYEVYEGSELTLAVEASVSDGGTLSYQWYKDEAAIEGATDATYTVVATLDDGGNYYVVVTNTLESGETAAVYSATCAVTVAEAPVVTGYAVTGSLTKSGSTETATVELIANGEVVASTTIAGKTGTYAFEDVAPGAYTVKVSKTKHADHEYVVEVVDADVAQDVEIWLYGDVTGDGIINAGDVLQINRKIANMSSMFNQVVNADYRLKVANVTKFTTKDDLINAADVLQVNRKVANQTSVFDSKIP